MNFSPRQGQFTPDLARRIRAAPCFRAGGNPSGCAREAQLSIFLLFYNMFGACPNPTPRWRGGRGEVNLPPYISSVHARLGSANFEIRLAPRTRRPRRRSFCVAFINFCVCSLMQLGSDSGL